MNILFLSIGNLENIDNRGIYTDLLRKFRDENHNVYVVCANEKRNNQQTFLEIQKNVSFLRVRVGNITKSNLIEKGFATLNIERLFLKAIKKYYNNVKFDLILYSTPPITFEKVITYIKKKDNAKSYLLLKDIFPQNAVDINMFSTKSPIYKFFRNKEKKLYRNSDHIGCMTPANVQYILEHNSIIDENKVEVCPNSISPIDIIKDKNQAKEIRQKYGIPLNKVMFIYGGNLGKPQGIDFLIDCLHANKSKEAVYFLIVGSGTEYSKLETYFAENHISNAQLHAQLPTEDYNLLVHASDVGLIFLDNRFTIPNFPSRLLSYMQASIPVLAATDTNTDVKEIIKDGDFGEWCQSNDVKGFTKKVNSFLNKIRREQMGKNSRQYLLENYTVDKSYEIIMNHFEKENRSDTNVRK